VKTLAIKTLISLASVDQEILTQERVMKAIEPRLHDGEETVAKAAFDACQGLSVAFPSLKQRLVDHSIGVLRQFSRGKAFSSYSSAYVQCICQTLSISPTEQSSAIDILEMALRTLKIAVKRNNYALRLEAIRLISRVPVEASIVYFTSQKKLDERSANVKEIIPSSG